MRLRILLSVERETRLPLNYGHQLTSAVYALLERADPNYAHFLHSEGYTPPDESAEARGMPRRFKGFTFGPLCAERSRVDTLQRGNETLIVAPGTIEWQVASPVEQFLQTFASGLLASGELRIGSARLPVQSAETLPAPHFTTPMRFRCLSPVVASVPEEVDGVRRARYLRPPDAEWSARLSANLRGKGAALGKKIPKNAQIAVTWDPDYLKRSKGPHPGTKLITYKEIKIVGVLCPFEMSGDLEMIRTAYDCGLGEKNAAGFGMVEVIKNVA